MFQALDSSISIGAKRYRPDFNTIVDKGITPGENGHMIIDAHNHVNWLGYTPEKAVMEKILSGNASALLSR